MTQAQKYLPNNIQVCKHLTVQIHQQPHYPLPLACSVNIDKTVLPCPNVPSTIYVLLAHITIFFGSCWQISMIISYLVSFSAASNQQMKEKIQE